MTLDHLEKEFWGGEREQPVRVRLARVVRALRDEIASQFGFNERWNAGALSGAFNDILGGLDAEGEAAGACADGAVVQRQRHGENDRQSKDGAEVSPRRPDPAADPSRAVCEWTPNGFEYQPQCGPAYMWVQTAHKLSVKQCRCGKPIKFTEAK